jgi:hypothetical protein
MDFIADRPLVMRRTIASIAAGALALPVIIVTIVPLPVPWREPSCRGGTHTGPEFCRGDHELVSTVKGPVSIAVRPTSYLGPLS